MVVRMLEYDFAIALDNIMETNNIYEMLMGGHILELDIVSLKNCFSIRFMQNTVIVKELRRLDVRLSKMRVHIITGR